MIAGAILAAGEGRRFGGAKQVAELNGRPLLEHVIGAMTAAPTVGSLVVVLGAHAEEIRSRVDFAGAEPIECPEWREGIAASIRCAIDALPGADPLVIALGDQPGITQEAIDAVVGATLRDPAVPAVRATYDGRPGHPVAVRPSLFDELRGLQGDDGARDVLSRAGALEVDCTGLATGADVDTPAQLEELRR